jgi:hypothetical protein
VRAGSEVCISYGAGLGNAALLEWFGCALPRNTAEVVRVELRLVEAEEQELLPGSGGRLVLRLAREEQPAQQQQPASSFALLPGLPALDGLQLVLDRVRGGDPDVAAAASAAEDGGGDMEGGVDSEVEAFVEAAGEGGRGRAAVRTLRALLQELLRGLEEDSGPAEEVAMGAAASAGAVPDEDTGELLKAVANWRACLLGRVAEHVQLLGGV